MNEKTLFLFNTTIMTGGEGVYSLVEIDREGARKLWLTWDGKHVSAIGHEATAKVMTTIISDQIEVNRIPAIQKVGDVAIVLKMNGRIPEGTILTDINEIEKVGYKLYRMEKESDYYDELKWRRWMTPNA